MIKTTLGALVAAEPALAKVLAVQLDAKIRYHAMKLARLVAQETKHFAEEQDKLIHEFGAERPVTQAEKDRGLIGLIYEVKPECVTVFLKKRTDLSNVEVTIPWGPLTTSMLDSYPQVTGQDCLALGPLFELDPS